MGGIVNIWDCRSGRSILSLVEHAKSVLAIDFHPNSYCLATGSADHTAKIWDLRKKTSIYTLPAHSALISSIKWQRRTRTNRTPRRRRLRRRRGQQQQLTDPAADAEAEPDSEMNWTDGRDSDFDSHSDADAADDAVDDADSATNGTGQLGLVAPSSTTSDYLLTSSYDGTIRVWDGFTLAPVSTLRGHTSFVMKCDAASPSQANNDIHTDSDWIVSAGFDRSWKLWSLEQPGEAAA